MSGLDADKARRVIDIVINKFDVENIENISDLRTSVFYICKQIAVFWKKSNRTKSNMLAKYSDWLKLTEKIDLRKATAQDKEQIGSKRGRPKSDFGECSKRAKRRRLTELTKVDESAMKILLENSDAKDNKMTKLSADEALSLIVEAKLTKHQYLLIRGMINKKTSCEIFPSYKKILTSKTKCYPKNEQVTETSAEIELQSLLDHTVTRIVDSDQTTIAELIGENRTSNIALIGKWGFDGSTGHSEYKQSFSDTSTDDGSLFVTSYVPLQLKLLTNDPADHKILWKNPRPSSTRFCRPLRFQFAKETSSLSVREEAHIKQQIEKLISTKVTINNQEYSVQHMLQLTMVDGKVRMKGVRIEIILNIFFVFSRYAML